MRKILTVVVCLCAVSVMAQKTNYLEPKPLEQAVSPQLKPVAGGAVKVPVITWGGDVATILADSDGLFKKEGLQVTLFDENDFAKQAQMCLNGETPYLRGTLGMINAAAQSFKQAGTELVVIYQLTWSVGGDCMVVRDSVRKPEDLKGKTIALQLYGPHMDYVANLLANAGIKQSDVHLKYLKELSLPKEDTKGKIIDPVSAFAAEPSLDAVMCISPDAAALTSGGKIGSGSEGSVKGARILVSTKAASRIICDVYAVRKDYCDAHRGEVQSFVTALLKGEEALRDLLAQKAGQQAKYRQLLAKAADMLFGASQATADVEGLLGDCEFVGYAGNVSFFTGQGTTRSMKTLTDEIQTAFSGMGLMAARIPLRSAEWDYAALAKGLKYAGTSAATPKFNQQAVAAKVESMIAAEPSSWESDGTLFVVEINFEPNQAAFAEEKYAADYDKAMKLAQTYAGAVMVVEGHSDPLGVAKARERNENPTVVAQMEQAAKNLSLQRANAVRGSYLTFCKGKGIVVDESQLVPVGMGVASPKYNPPKTKEEWAANRRVVFRVKQINAEATEFSPVK